MKKILIYFWLVLCVVAASGTYANTCSDDPNECTLKALCQTATSLDGNSTVWSSSANVKKHVALAKQLSMDCGTTIAVDPCDADPAECKVSQICDRATIQQAGRTSWNPDAASHAAIAQTYGLNCGVGEVKTTSKVKAAVCLGSATEVCTNKQTCERATHRGRWKVDTLGKQYVAEAKRRGLTCGVKGNLKIAICTPNSVSSCSPNTLCNAATYMSYGVKYWKPMPSVYAYEARKRGLSCGVKVNSAIKETNECLKNLYKCSPDTLCKVATSGTKWNRSTPKHVAAAQKKGLTCGVKSQTSLSKRPQKQKKITDLSNRTLTNAEICKCMQRGQCLNIKSQVFRIYRDSKLTCGYTGKTSNQTTKRPMTASKTQPVSIKAAIAPFSGQPESIEFEKSHFLKLSNLQRKQLQYGLKNLGFYRSSVDGIYGPKTQTAVRGFAMARGIRDGYPNSVLRKLTSEVSVPSSFAITEVKRKSDKRPSKTTSSNNNSEAILLKLGCAIFIPGCAEGMSGGSGELSSGGNQKTGGVSSTFTSDNSCTRDGNCGYNQMCIKKPGKTRGICFNKPSGIARDQSSLSCKNDTDCPTRGRCDRTYKICVER